MSTKERELMIMQLILEAIKLIISMQGETTDAEIIAKRAEINEAVSKWQ